MMLALKCMDVIGYKRPKNNKGRQINFRKGVIVTAKNRGIEKRFSRYQYNSRSFFTKGEIFEL